MSNSPHVVPARFRFGRDPESDLAQPPVVHADELMLRRWYRLHDRSRTLARAELELLVEDMSAHPELWRHLLHHSPDERHGPTPATMRPASRLERIATGRPEARVTAAGAGGRRRRRARTGAFPEPLTLEPLTLPSPLRGEGEA